MSPQHITTSQQVLLSKGVAEANILCLCIIAAPEGITKLCSRRAAVCAGGSGLRLNIHPRFLCV